MPGESADQGSLSVGLKALRFHPAPLSGGAFLGVGDAIPHCRNHTRPPLLVVVVPGEPAARRHLRKPTFSVGEHAVILVVGVEMHPVGEAACDDVAVQLAGGVPSPSATAAAAAAA